MVGASEDLEESLVTPALVPGVGAEPVLGSVLDAPAEDLDGVTSELGASGVLVDTALVGEEVLVDGEGALERVCTMDELTSTGPWVMISVMMASSLEGTE